MGVRIATLAMESGEFELVAAMEAGGHPLVGKSYGAAAGLKGIDLMVSVDCRTSPQVIVDFSSPEGTVRATEEACRHSSALVVGTTGLSEPVKRALEDASKVIPVLYAPNMSLGMNLLFGLVGQAAKMLGEEYDIEITESHHRFKKDAPSGTALELARQICLSTGKNPDETLVFDRHEVKAPRKKGEIGMSALRMGDVVGEHSVYYACLGERIELRHVATSRDTFARGALRAAEWVVGKPPAMYSMKDVLEL
jgi:4-hydroxy-tetrahydrodipicolinate reductase